MAVANRFAACSFDVRLHGAEATASQVLTAPVRFQEKIVVAFFMLLGGQSCHRRPGAHSKYIEQDSRREYWLVTDTAFTTEFELSLNDDVKKGTMFEKCLGRF